MRGQRPSIVILSKPRNPNCRSPILALIQALGKSATGNIVPGDEACYAAALRNDFRTAERSAASVGPAISTAVIRQNLHEVG